MSGTGTLQFDASSTSNSTAAISVGLNAVIPTIAIAGNNVFGAATGTNAELTFSGGGTGQTMVVDAVGGTRSISNALNLNGSAYSLALNTTTGDTNLVINNIIHYEDTSKNGSGHITVGTAGVSAYALLAGQAITKLGAGSLTFTGVDTSSNPVSSALTGAYAVSAGSLIFDGSTTNATSATANTVAVGATLGGNGTLDFPGTTTHTVSGTLTPGDPNSNNGVGTFTLGSATNNHNNLTITGSSAVYSVVLNGATAGTGYGQTNVFGTVTLASNPTITASMPTTFHPTVGQLFDVLNDANGSAVIGTFTNSTVSVTNANGTYTFAVQTNPSGAANVTLDLTSILAPSHAIISLTPAPGAQANYGTLITQNASPTTGQGTFSPNNSDSKLDVTGTNNSYTLAQVTNINGAATATTASVESAGFNPSSDTEIYALNVQLATTNVGGATLATELGQLVTDINSNSSLGFNAVVASTTSPSPELPAGYNLFLTLTGTQLPTESGTSDSVLGFDLSSSNDTNLADALAVTAVAVVPEPASMGLVMLGGVGLLARRRARKI